MVTRTWCAVVVVFAAATAQADDWPMYGRTAAHSFAADDASLDQRSLGSLALAWSFTPGDAVTATPTVVDGTVYVGSWDGYFYALDQRTGALRWRLALDCDAMSLPQPAVCVAQGYPASDPLVRQGTDGGVVTSSAAVVDGIVYFGGAKTLYAVRASDGRVIWKRVLCGNPDAPSCERDPADPVRIFSSPTVARGKVYVGSDVDGAAGYRGRIWALDAATGAVDWVFEVDPAVDAQGHEVRRSDGSVVAQNRGCGAVWSSGALDGRHVIFTTGDCQNAATTPYHEAILALDADSGALVWKFRPLPESNTCDLDFGASANVFNAGGQHLVGAGSKDGTYYALHATDGTLAWATNVVYGGSDGGFIGTAAIANGRVFGATMYGDGEFGFGPLCDPSNPADGYLQDPSMHAFDASTGAVLWEQPASYGAAATTVSNDVVIAGTLGLGADLPPAVRFFDPATGAVLRELPQAGSVASAVVPVGDTIVFGTGNSYDGAGSSIQAWRVRH